MRLFLIKLLFLITLSTSCFGVVRLSLDPLESQILFQSKLFSFIQVNGNFEAITVDVDLEDTQSIKRIRARVDSNSINTNNKTRDRDLRKSKFLDSVNYPFITFTVEGPISINQTEVTGILTIKSIQKPIKVPVKLQYYKTETSGQYVLSVKSDNFIINRSDFNVNAYSFLISDEVKLNLDLILKVYLKPS